MWLNQCLHTFDVIARLLGPGLVRGRCQLGRYHNIEVEDNVIAYLNIPTAPLACASLPPARHPDEPVQNAGTRGRVVLENHRITLCAT